MGVFVSLRFSPLPGVGSALASVWFSCSACSLPPLPPKHKHTHTHKQHEGTYKVLKSWACTESSVPEEKRKITTKMFHNDRTLWTRWVWSLIRCRRERDVHTLCPVASVGGKWHFYQPEYFSRSENTLQFSRIYFAEGLKELTSSTTTSQNIMSGCFPNTQLSFNVRFQTRFWCQQCVEKLSLQQTKKNERLDVCFSSGSIRFLREASANVGITAGFVFLRRSQLYQGSVYESTILQECFIKGSISDFSVLMTGWWVEWHDCMELWVNGEWMHSICNF